MLGILAVVAATACVVGAFTLLGQHDLRTNQILTAKREQTDADMKRLEDDTRKIMRELGFNLLILPKDQNLSDLYADNFAAKTMPEEFAAKLAQSKIATINHVLPSLQRKIKWPEKDCTIILFGTRGELPMAAGNEKKPLLELVPPGKVVLGHELYRSLSIKVGDELVLLGRTFTVEKLHPERGNADDITIYVNLKVAQELLDLPGQINAIKALECNCAADRLSQIRNDVEQILPDTQVTELASQSLARAEARNRAAKAREDALQAETVHREQLRIEQETFAAVLVPLVVAGALIGIAVLTWINVRDRRVEIGTLRAIGWKRRQVFVLILGKAILQGCLGAVVGCVIGTLVGMLLQEAVTPETITANAASGMTAAKVNPFSAVDLRVWLVVVAATPLLTSLASWLPALVAARRDPAVVLSEGY